MNLFTNVRSRIVAVFAVLMALLFVPSFANAQRGGFSGGRSSFSTSSFRSSTPSYSAPTRSYSAPSYTAPSRPSFSTPTTTTSTRSFVAPAPAVIPSRPAVTIQSVPAPRTVIVAPAPRTTVVTAPRTVIVPSAPRTVIVPSRPVIVSQPVYHTSPVYHPVVVVGSQPQPVVVHRTVVVDNTPAVYHPFNWGAFFLIVFILALIVGAVIVINRKN